MSVEDTVLFSVCGRLLYPSASQRQKNGEPKRGQTQPKLSVPITPVPSPPCLFQALMSLFVLASKDGWVNIMYNGLDAVAVDQQVGVAGARSGLGSRGGTQCLCGQWPEMGVSKTCRPTVSRSAALAILA